MLNNLSIRTKQERKERTKEKWRTLVKHLRKEARPKRTIPITRMKISNHEWNNILHQYSVYVGDTSDLGDQQGK